MVVSDSSALRLALLPTVDCLPFLYAEKQGIYDTLGLPLELVLHQAALDCDTAYLGGSVHGGVSDTVRMRFLGEKGVKLIPLFQLNSRLALISSSVLRLKRLEDLRRRTVVGERFSTSEILIKKTLAGRRLHEGEYYTPQISALHLRASMLDNDQIDAALLPEPFLTVAEQRGHKVLHVIDGKQAQNTCLVMNESAMQDSVRAEQVEKLIRGYNLAAEEINNRGVSACRDLMVSKFGITRAVADSVKLPAYTVIS